MVSRLGSRYAIRAAIACTAVGLAFGLTACGGDDSSSDADQSEDVAAIQALGDGLQSAIDSGEPGQICDRTDPEVVKTQFKTKANCVKQLEAAFAQQSQLPDVNFDTVEVSGDLATAAGAGSANYYFRKVGGKWFLSSQKPDSPTVEQTTEAG